MLNFTPAQMAFVNGQRREFNRRQAQMETSGLVGNALPVPRDVWGEWDRQSVELQRTTLTVFNVLSQFSRPIDIGKLMTHFRTTSDSGEVNVSLDGRSKARTDQPTFEYYGTPIPIVDSQFSFGWRQMASASTEGFDLESDGRVNADYKVLNQIENMALDGDTTISYNGQALYGIRTLPQRNTRSTGVTLNGATGAQWIEEFTATLALLHGDNFRVPARILVNWDDWFYASNTEFTAGYPKTIAARVMEIFGIESIVPCETIDADEIIAYVPDRRVVEVLNAMPFMSRPQFRANPEDDYNFVVMMAAVPQFKFDHEGNCGIAHSS